MGTSLYNFNLRKHIAIEIVLGLDLTSSVRAHKNRHLALTSHIVSHLCISMHTIALYFAFISC